MAYAVINPTTYAAKQAVKNAGCSHVVIVCYWDALQPSAGALSGSAVTALNQQLTDARTLGLKVILEQALQYPPGFVQTGVEKYLDQNGNEGNSPQASGGNLRNWMWTANGRGFVQDFFTRVYAAISPANRSNIVGVRVGGGYAGELQYCRDSLSAPHSYWAFGTAMQTGAGLAEGLSACPVPGYTFLTGTRAQDVAFLNWYMGGIEDWLGWQLSTLSTIGWRCKLYVLHPSFSVRRNHTFAQAAGEIAKGVDFTRALGIYKNNPQAWPWSTWINGTDPFPGSVVDSDLAAWRKLYAEARVRGKHYDMWGENTGGETVAGMTRVFDEVLAPGTGSIGYSGTPQGEDSRYQNLAWLDYGSLTSNSGASLEDYQNEIDNRSA